MMLSNRIVVVTGCAGFIASHLTEALLARGNTLLGIDNFSAGKREFLKSVKDHPRFKLVQGDLLTMNLEDALQGAEVLCHFAANPDVRVGASDTRTHFDQNIEVTYRLLEAARRKGLKDIIFPSTSTVYGEASQIPTPENYGPLLPISIYGASKLACEALISAYGHTFDMRAVLYRFANVVGPRSTHNVLHDFIRKLRENPGQLEILGASPGTSKSYVHVSDCISGMMLGAERAREQIEVYNIGSKDRTNVNEIADIVVQEMQLKDVDYQWRGGVLGGRGWIGDVKQMLLDVSKLESRGWSPRMDSKEAIRTAVKEIIA